jgi:hypothetical protein
MYPYSGCEEDGDDGYDRVSSGEVIHDPYTGQTFEALESPMPLPGLRQEGIQPSQLKYINPMLLHLSGGYNHHAPPPSRKETEQPVSALAGGNALGPGFYNKFIQSRVKGLAAQGMAGNKHGLWEDEGEDAYIGEQPAGYRGFQPVEHPDVARIQPGPVDTAKEQDLNGYVHNPATQPVDLVQQDAFTAKMVTRKDRAHVVDRPAVPAAYIEDVTVIPVAYNRAGGKRRHMTRTYITPGYLGVSKATAPAAGTRAWKKTEGARRATLNLGAHHPAAKVPVAGIRGGARKPKGAHPDAAVTAPPQPAAPGDHALKRVDVSWPEVRPAVPAVIPSAGVVKATPEEIRRTLKLASVEESFAVVAELASVSARAAPQTQAAPSVRTGRGDSHAARAPSTEVEQARVPATDAPRDTQRATMAAAARAGGAEREGEGRALLGAETGVQQHRGVHVDLVPARGQVPVQAGGSQADRPSAFTLRGKMTEPTAAPVFENPRSYNEPRHY